ncbi:MAG: hypothetical protein ACI4T3_04505 [Lactobacillus sp.]
MTSKKNLKKMRKNHKDHKEIGPNAKKFAAGAASVLLGAGIARGVNVRATKSEDYEGNFIPLTEEVEADTLETSADITKSADVTSQGGQESTGETSAQGNQSANETEGQQTTGNTQPATQGNAEISDEDGLSAQADTDTTPTNSATAGTTEGANSAETATGTGASDTQKNESSTQPTGTNSVTNSEDTDSSAEKSTNDTPTNGSLGDSNSSSEGNSTNDGQNPGATDPSNEKEDTKEGETKTSQELVDEANKNYENQITIKLNEAKDKEYIIGWATAEEEKVFYADDSNLADVLKQFNQYTAEQIEEIDRLVKEYTDLKNKYNQAMEEYKQNVEDLEAYKENLLKWGISVDEDLKPSDISQGLIFKDEEAKFDVVINNPAAVTEVSNNFMAAGDYAKDLKNNFEAGKVPTCLNFDKFFKIDASKITDKDAPLFTVTYDGLTGSIYKGNFITKIEITFSGWKENHGVWQDWEGGTKDPQYYKPSGIYLNNKFTDGFFYRNSNTVTMEMTLYDKNGNAITLDEEHPAYIIIGSLNNNESGGRGNSYIEKVSLYNDDEKGYGGNPITFASSSITKHYNEEEKCWQLYSDFNNDILMNYDGDKYEANYKKAAITYFKQRFLNMGKNYSDAEAQKLAEDFVAKFWHWDDDKDRKNEIFAAGAFQVHGQKIKLQFSSTIGSAWATYKTDVPKDYALSEPSPLANILIYKPARIEYKASEKDPDPDPKPTPDPDPDPDPDPTPTPDPDPTPTPDPDPTPTPDPEDPDPLPEEEPGSEYPDQPEFVEEEESVEPHDTAEPKKEVATSQTNVVTEKTTPETVSTESVTEESQTTTEVTHTNNEETLPETGENNDEFAKVMSGLAAALGLTGLAATSKRRKKATVRNKKNKKNGK